MFALDVSFWFVAAREVDEIANVDNLAILRWKADVILFSQPAVPPPMEG